MPRTASKKNRLPAVVRGPLAMVEARRRLTNLPEEMAKHPEMGVVKITRRGKPVLAVMSWELYESVSETLEIMSDPEMMAAVSQGAQDLEQGNIHRWEKVKNEFGL